MESIEVPQSKKAQAIEYIHVKTSELYRLIIKALKWIGIIAGFCIGLYLLSYIFELLYPFIT